MEAAKNESEMEKRVREAYEKLPPGFAKSMAEFEKLINPHKSQLEEVMRQQKENEERMRNLALPTYSWRNEIPRAEVQRSVPDEENYASAFKHRLEKWIAN